MHEQKAFISDWQRLICRSATFHFFDFGISYSNALRLAPHLKNKDDATHFMVLFVKMK